MPRRRVLRLAVTAVVGVLVLAVVASVVAAVLVVRRPLPTTSGRIHVTGLDDEVIVTRDERGVPTITATTATDLFRAQGYVSAQDRFFEMDYRRHVTAGRLSELVGQDADALEADKVIRTLGWRRVAEQEWDLLSPRTRAALEAYADGVNSYLSGRHPSQIAVEYTILGRRVHVADPEPWDPVDSLAWLKALAWDLRGNYDDELERAVTYAAVQDVGRVDELFPPYPQDANRPILGVDDVLTSVQPTAARTDLDLGDDDVQRALDGALRALDAVPHLVGDGAGIGSNSWAVSGALTASGLPILANDPHLGISAPGIWSQVGLRCAPVSVDCPYDVSGFANAGMPGVVIGHGANLAWGLTNLGADVSDFFLERVADGRSAVDDRTAPVRQRTETIEVNGGDPVVLTVRETRHGPIVSDVLDLDEVRRSPTGQGGGRYEVALSWTALQPGRTADAILALDTAQDAADVARAAALLEVPAQNIVFATTDGHIGYQAPGRVPVRASVLGGRVPSDGSWPRPGWDSAYDWQGFVPPEQLPHTLDPADGFVVAANQAVTPAGVGPFLTGDWDYGYRAQRIRDELTRLVGSGEKLTVADMTTLQSDQLNPYAVALVPRLLGLRIANAYDDDGQELLRTWDLRSSADSAAAAYFSAVWAQVLTLTFADELPDGHTPTGDSRWLEVVRRLLDDPSSTWWDDRSTPGVVEGRDEVLTRAMVSARRQLTVQLGRQAADWRWGKLHVAAPRHPVLGGDAVPWLVRRLVNPRPIAVGGGPAVVDATTWDAREGSFEVTVAPSMRMVVDLGDLDSSTWVNLTGTSGHPGSTHYTDQLDAWAHGRTFPWPFTRAATEADAEHRLTLTP